MLALSRLNYESRPTTGWHPGLAGVMGPQLGDTLGMRPTRKMPYVEGRKARLTKGVTGQFRNV